MKIEYMMKVIGHKREKKEGEKRVKHHGREMQQERVEDGLETRKKRFSDEKFRLITCLRLTYKPCS